MSSSIFSQNPDVFDATIKIPFGLCIYGCVMAGKSVYIKNLIDNRDRLLSDPLDYIVYFYGERSKTVRELEADPIYHGIIETVEGLPEDVSEYIKTGKRGLHIYDDLMDDISNSKQILDLVTKKCQHHCVSWIITLQNAFHHGSERISITRSAHYLTVFNSPLDKTVPRLLASRIMPENRKAFLDIFAEATRKPYSYLFVDGRQGTPDKARLRSDLFGSYQLVYIPTEAI